MTVSPTSPPGGLSARDVHLAYGRDVVIHAASISLSAGIVTALIGPNGSGKSTLLRALARLHLPSSGRVAFSDGADVLSLDGRELARRITVLSQSRSTPGGLSVRELVGYGRHPHRARWTGRDRDGAAAVERAMALTGVASFADRPVQALAAFVLLAACGTTEPAGGDAA